MTAIHNMLVGSQEDSASLSVSSTPAAVFEFIYSITATSGACVASAIGGSGSYSYSWTKLTNNFPQITIDSPSSASTSFSVLGIPVGASWSDTVRCTVTDTVNPSVTGFINISVTFVRIS